MNEKSKISRRSFFRGAATVAGAALATTIIPIRVANAQAKADKASMKYQDHPKDGNRCDECVYFQAPKSCGIVAGDISPEGWCVAFNKKK